ncbi:MAG: cell division protein FtsQ/DivIB [Candidatus Omnitrophica bacterium]|nr:cell division protein FtsQ/DivIB [Candidatus Omnitrophota bacterium]
MPDYKRLVRRKVPTRKISQANPKIKVNIVKIIAVAILIALVAYTFLSTRLLLASASIFKIDGVVIVDQNGLPVDDSDGIFSFSKLQQDAHLLNFDLNKVVQDVEVRHPEFSSVIVRKQFPSTLMIIVKKRQPMAIIGSKDYLSDEQGFILPFESRYEDLPMITGIDAKYTQLYTQSHSLKLQKALDLFKDLKQARIYPSYMVSRIDARNDLNIVFYLDNKTEVKMGGNSFGEKAALLKEVLAKLESEQDLAPKYIDMRFDNPSVLPQD